MVMNIQHPTSNAETYPRHLPRAHLQQPGMGWGGGTSKDNTKPQKTIQSPKSLYKAPTDYTKTYNIRQNPRILDEDQQYLTSVATTINLTYNSQHLILKKDIY